MASIKSPLGRIKGKIGNLVFKNLDDKNIIAAAPSEYTLPTDDASVARRTKFSFVVKFSAALLKLSLRLLWKKSAPGDDRMLNKIFKTNFPLVTSALDFTGVRLTSKADFKVENPEVNLLPVGIQVIVGALGTTQKIDTVNAAKIAVEGVICLSDPTDAAAPKVSFLPFSGGDQNIVLTDPLTFAISFDSEDQITAERYATKSAALILVTKDANGLPVQCSKTITT